MIPLKSFTVLLVSGIFTLTGSASSLLEHAFSKYGDFPKIPVEIKKSFCYNTLNMYKIFPAFIY